MASNPHPPPDLHRALVELVRSFQPEARVRADPVGFVHRYEDRRDQEVAAVLASQLAFGRVASFATPLGRLLDLADRAGGPWRWVTGFEDSDALAVHDIGYRWIRGTDIACALRGVKTLVQAGPLSTAFAGPTAEAAMAKGIGALRTAMSTHNNGLWTRGQRAFVASPDGGSACKRWCMFMRWMVRPADGVDLGLWTHLSPSTLTMPLDTHVHRIALQIGLTERRTANWRTARDVTRALARLDPADPERFDFALAHLGISGQCRGSLVPAVCGSCALAPLCVVTRGRRIPAPESDQKPTPM